MWVETSSTGRKRAPAVLALSILALSATPESAAAPPQPYRVGAYYHGAWSFESCTVCSPHNDDWWKGVREYAASQIDPTLPWWQESFVHLEPALGFYDDTRTETLRRQILQARANGLSFFVFNWYWDRTLAQGAGGQRYAAALRSFLAAPNSQDLDFAITVTAHPWDTLQIPNTHIPRAVARILDVFSRPHYLRTEDGRPILFITDTRGIREGRAGDVADFIALVKDRALVELGTVPFVVVATENESPTGTSEGRCIALRTLPGLDGVSCYNEFYKSVPPGGGGRIGSLARYNAEILDHFDRWKDWVPSVIPCHMADFDEKPRAGIGMPPHEVRYLQDFSLGLFRQGLDRIKGFADRYDGGPVDDMVVLYAWNEWREAGHSLEPSAAEGNLMLHEVSTVFGLDTRGSTDCRVRGLCPESVEPPTGHVDRADCDRIAGWVRDPDSSIATLVEIVPTDSDRPVAAIRANALRRDLPFVDKAHGFVLPTPDALKTGSTRTFRIRAADLGLDGQPVGPFLPVPGSPRSVTCGGGSSGTSDATPRGTFDVARCDRLAGWARDADSPVPLQVEIFADGPRGAGGNLLLSTVAGLFRGDLPFADQHHGFRVETPGGIGAGRDLYAYAVDVGDDGRPTGERHLLARSPLAVSCGD